MTTAGSVNARQFIASTDACRVTGLDVLHAFGSKLRVATHPRLAAAHRTTGDNEILILGEIIDPRQPRLTNDEIAEGVLRAAVNFDAFERATRSLAGRWVALIAIGDQTRLYPDAGGTKSVFFCGPEGRLAIASQPGLLVEAGHAELEAERRRAFLSEPHHGDSWPFTLTPFRAVQQLLPNHYLDIDRGTAVRFWPRREPPAQPLDEAATTAIEILRGTVVALRERGRTTLSLTAGYDSRTIFAASTGELERLSVARVSGYHLPFCDSIVPRQLARRYRVGLREVRASPDPRAFDLVQSNSGGMIWDRAEYMLPSFGSIATEFFVTGQLSEITRCYYYPTGNHPQPLTASQVAAVAKYGGNAVALPEIERWLARAPALSCPTLLDLAFWEHREGNWASLLATALDTFYTVVFAYNCRELLESMLGVERQHRIAPYRLHRRICELAAPDCLAFEFNDSWLDRWMASSPWRRRVVVSLRRRASRFPREQRRRP